MNYSRLFMGLVLWGCIISLTITGAYAMTAAVVKVFTPDPWYIQWTESVVDFIGKLF